MVEILINLNLDPTSACVNRAQLPDLYSDSKHFGNHNQDSAQFFIHTMNQCIALCTYDSLQDPG